jgi:hypothetical protein
LLATVLLAGFSLVTIVTAQDDGQFCLRAFEDRNANGLREPSVEPLLTRGLSANLLDSGGVVIKSQLMEESPNAAQGVLCFQFLAAGQYTMMVSSADFQATTPDSMTIAISSGAIPTVFEFGGQRIISETTGTPPANQGALDAETMALLERAVVAGLGTGLVVAAMIILGALIYLVVYRRRLGHAPDFDPRRTSGSYPVTTVADTGEHRGV